MPEQSPPPAEPEPSDLHPARPANRLFPARRPEPMPSWVPHAALWVAGAFGLLYAGIRLFSVLQPLLTMVGAGMFIAFALEPGIAGLVRRGWRRGAATGALFVLVVGALVGLVVSIGALVGAQGASLVEELPQRAHGVADFFEAQFNVHVDMERLSGEDGFLTKLSDELPAAAVDAAPRVATAVGQVLATCLFAFYFAADGPRLRRALVSLVRPSRQGEVLRVFEIAISKTGGYLYSRALLAALAFVVHAVAFSVIGLDHALPLALWLAVMSQFIPVVGTFIGGGLPVLVALGASPGKALAVLVVFTAFTQVKNIVLAPRLARTTVELHPAVGFASVIAGAALLGPVGALLAVPAAATVQAFVSTYLHRHDIADDDHGLLAMPDPASVSRRRRTVWSRRSSGSQQ